MDGTGSPLKRALAPAALAAAPAFAALAALTLFGPLSWPAAALAGAACLAALVVLADRALDHLGRLAGLADPDGPPGRRRSRLFPELAAALRLAGTASARRLRGLENRAESAEAIVDNLPYPLVLIDGDRRILRATVGVTELIGPATPGADLSSILRDPGVLAAVDRILAGGDREAAEFENLLPVRSVLNVQIRKLSLPPDDAPAAAIAVHDITEIRRIHQARADFVANASHELKTPLAVLAACAGTLQGPARDDPEGRRKFIDVMGTHIGRMTRLIEDLLSLSRIEMNERTPPDGVVDLPELLSDVAGTLRLPASRRGIRIEVENALARPAVRGDAEELTQVFQNLVDNAVKYSGDASVVRVVARDDGTDVAVSVVDEGPGIADEHKTRLTERFYRVDAERSRELGGTGLGLAIVKHVVNRHRGRLDIESEPGRGSAFTVRLPTEEA